jgi:hypothetical protein
VSYPTAKVGAGFCFDSNDDGVDVPHDAAFNLGAGGFSALFWMCGTKAQPDYFSALLDKSHGWIDSTGWAVHCWTNDGHVSLAIGQGGGGNANFQEVRSHTDLLDGVFHQVAAVWTGTEAQLFVDGALEDHQACLPPVNNARPLHLGYFWGGEVPQRFFRGALDEVMIFDRALSAAEIASSALRITLGNAGCVGTNFSFAFPTVSNFNYAVEYSDDLRATNWLFHHMLTGDGSLQPVLIPMTNTAQRFFRVRQP